MIDFIKSSLWTWATAFVVLGLAIIGVIVGVVTKGRWKDRGLITKDGHNLMWMVTDFPIAVLLHKDLSDVIIQVVEAVVKKYATVISNRHLFIVTRLDHQSFDWDSYPPAGYVSIVPGPGINGDSVKGITEHKYEKETGRILSVKMTIPSIKHKGILNKIITHELGHALGLDHDESRSSIMHSMIIRRSQELTSKDKKLLRSIYESRK